MSSYAISEIGDIKMTQAEIERTLDDLEKKASINSIQLGVLQEEVRKLAKSLNEIISDVNDFKEKIIEVQYLVSYIVSRLLIGRGVVLNTKKLWKKKTMDDSLFEYLNFTLPCGSDCPVEYGEPKSCELDLEKHSLHLEFTVPVINPNLTIVESDPFFLMVKNENQTCRVEYHEPKNAMLSISDDCVHAMDMGTESRGRLYFPNSNKCQTRKASVMEKEWFGITTCNPTKDGDELAFVQIKANHNRLHIYCPGQNFTLGEKRVVQCPNKIFTLPLTATFTLNNVTYQGKTMQLVYTEKDDPLMQEKLNWHLTPLFNWDSLNQTFPVLQPLPLDHWTRRQGWGIWDYAGLLGFGTGFIILALCGRWIIGYCRKPQLGSRKVRITKKKENNEELQLQKTGDSSEDEISIHG